MTESTQTAPRSRRALLAGAIGGLGVWAASAIGRAAPAEAAAGDPIRMGRLNRAAAHRPNSRPVRSKRHSVAIQFGAGNAIRAEAGQRPSRHGGGRQLGYRVRARWHADHWCPCRRREWGRGCSAMPRGRSGVAGFSVNGLGLQGWGKVVCWPLAGTGQRTSRSAHALSGAGMATSTSAGLVTPGPHRPIISLAYSHARTSLGSRSSASGSRQVAAQVLATEP